MATILLVEEALLSMASLNSLIFGIKKSVNLSAKLRSGERSGIMTLFVSHQMCYDPERIFLPRYFYFVWPSGSRKHTLPWRVGLVRRHIWSAYVSRSVYCNISVSRNYALWCLRTLWSKPEMKTPMTSLQAPCFKAKGFGVQRLWMALLVRAL